ncbi:unnamed protein product [Rhizoctonia solani]|uniref:NACHT domain-containing protein n=1 Tax=Rhizoctonia solani TaxID=456999 RepID=A0A8H3AK63_9AGAM|nr:unnamed protein product [Rhizoctonia solani]
MPTCWTNLQSFSIHLLHTVVKHLEMSFKSIFKRGKHKKRGSESHGNSPRADTHPHIEARSTSPNPEPSSSVLGLVTQPFMRRFSPSPHSYGQSNDWPNLAAFSGLLKQNRLFGPLAGVIDDLCWFIRAHESLSSRKKEYDSVRTQLEDLFADLREHFSKTPPAMTNSVLSLCRAIRTELREVYDTEDRDVISRHLQAENDLDKITGCYRRIQDHLERVVLNASLNTLAIVDKHAREAQLGKLNPSTSARYDSVYAHVVQRRECTPKTREQVLSYLKSWKDEHDGEKVCWINGMAGTGKTTIVNTLCSILDNNHELGASFFCSRSLPECRKVESIIPTIAYQLARFSDPFRYALLEALDHDPDVPTKALQVQFKRMILEPVKKVMHSLPKKVVVVVDALDECDNNNGVEQVLEILLERASELPIKFLVSSRPEYHIREMIFKSNLQEQLILHNLDENMVKEDIETYLREELASISTPLASDQLKTLVERAGVLFIYAATVVRYIKEGDSPDRLDAVLKVSDHATESRHGPSKQTEFMDDVYRVVLESALNHSSLEGFEKQRRKLVLHTVICSQEPLTVEALAGLLDLTPDRVMVALKPFWSVLHVSGRNATDRVNTLHASFPDFMLDPDRSALFVCDAKKHNRKLADLCFRRIERNNPQFNICNLESSYVFDEDVPFLSEKVKQMIPLDLLYACQYWPAHLTGGGKSNEQMEALHNFLSKRLLLWIEVLNLTKRIEKTITLMEMALSWMQAIKCPDSTLLLARDARRFVTMFATSPVSKSTPHLYVSTLASWPHDQPIARHYLQQTIDLVKIKGIETTERHLSLLSVVTVGFPVTCVAYSSNGVFFVAGTDRGTILIWDAMSCRMTIDPIEGHTEPIRAITISPNGTQICSGSHETLCVWDSRTGRRIAGPLEERLVRSVDYSLDGHWLASGSIDGTVRIWSTKNWQVRGKPLEGHHGRVFSVAFSPDGATIAVACEKLIYLYNALNSQIIGEPFSGHVEIVVAISFFPDGQHLLSGSVDCHVGIWDITGGQIASERLLEHIFVISDVTISPSGNTFASVAADGAIRIWDTKARRSYSLLRNTGTIRSIRFSPDGTRLISGCPDGTVRVWEVPDIPTEEVFHNELEGHGAWITSVVFSPCGNYLISGCGDATVGIWDLQRRSLGCNLLKGSKFVVVSAGVSADGSRVFSVVANKEICIWDQENGELEHVIGPLKTDDYPYQEGWAADFLFDGMRVVCGSESGRIYMWENNELSFDFAGHNHGVTAIAFSPDGQFFASGSNGGELTLWDSSRGGRLFDASGGEYSGISAVAFSPDCSQIASASSDGSIRLWDTKTGSPVGNLPHGHYQAVESIAFSPHGKLLVSGYLDMTIRVWDVASGKSVATFEGHKAEVRSVAFSPDGAQIASGSSDMTIRVWKTPPHKGTLVDDVREAASGEPTDMSKEDISGDWTMSENGWVQDHQGHLLLWVPPDLRSVLLWPQNIMLLARQGCIELDFTNVRIGNIWNTCFQSL